MLIQVNSDNNIDGNEQFASRVRSVVESALSRFSDRITRLEVHVSDENASKGGQADKRCMMEARIEGLRPIAVTHHAATMDQAIDGAAHKMVSSIDRTLGRLHDQDAHGSGAGTV